MELIDSKSDENIIPKTNSVDSFAKDFKKCFNPINCNKSPNDKIKKNNKKEDNIPKRPNKSISLIQTNFKTINQNSTPIEFYYEFKDFIKGEKPKKTNNNNKIKNIKQSLIQKDNNNINDNINNNINNSSEKKDKKHSNNKSNKKEDIFWEKVKYNMALKNERLNKLAYKIKMEQSISAYNEENKSNKKLNKSSILIYPTNRKPLYQYHNINDDSLSKDFDNFYKYYQKEQKLINNNKLYKKKKSINDYSNNISFNEDDKYQKFYEKKMNWIKKRDDKIKNEKNMIEEQDKKILNSFSFKPHIDKKSIQLVKKRNNFIDFMENKPNTERNYNNMMINKKEIYQKYCATIKPYISFYYEKSAPFYKKNNLSFTKRKPSVDIGMIHINKGKNIIIIKEKKDNNNNDNNNTSKDIKFQTNNNNNNNNNTYINKKNIFKMFKPEKKEIQKKKINNNLIEFNSQNDKNNNNNNNKYKIWWREINDKNFNNPKKEEKKNNWNDLLYKVNVRDNSSWNKVCVNKIMPKPEVKKFINDYIY